jgi:hypothetical protein
MGSKPDRQNRYVQHLRVVGEVKGPGAQHRYGRRRGRQPLTPTQTAD